LFLSTTFYYNSNNLGFLLARQGRSEEAITHYSEAIALYPDFLEAHYNLGRHLDMNGRKEEAVIHYEKVIQLNPHHNQTRTYLAGVLAKEQRFAEAMVHFCRAKGLMTNSAEADN